MSELRLNGIMPPLTTPFDEDGNLDLDGLGRNVERYSETGLTGYVALGSNGEAVHLSADERMQVLKTVRRVSDQSRPPARSVIAGVNELSTRAAIESARRAADCGAEAALVITPYYYKNAMSQEALLRHFTEVADTSPIPVLIYNVPQNTGVVVEPVTIASIAGHPNIVGVKDSSGNVTALSETVNQSPSNFAVLVGTGAILYPGLLMGATGAILAVACIAARACVELFDAAKAGELAKARELHNRIAPLSHTVTSRFGVAGLKAALDFAGYAGGPPRPPLLPLGESNREALKAVMSGSALFPGME